MVLVDFKQFPLWEDVMVLKALILGNIYFGSLWCRKDRFWIISPLEGYVSLEIWIFHIFYIGRVLVLKGPILDNFHFTGYVCLVKTDF